MSKKYESIFFPADDIEFMAASPKLSGLRAQGYSLTSLTLVEDQGTKKMMALMEPPVGIRLESEIARLQLTDCKGETHREMIESIEDLEANLAIQKRKLKWLIVAVGALSVLSAIADVTLGIVL